MKLFTTTAAALVLAAPMAFAQSADTTVVASADTMTTTETMTDMTAMSEEMDMASLIRTRDITGGAIYTTNQDPSSWDSWSMASVIDGVDDGWSEIGEIEDVVLSKSGQMIGVVAEVGGFLDIGDKHVLLPMDDVNLVAVDDVNYALVTYKNEEQLEQMESVDEGFWN